MNDLIFSEKGKKKILKMITALLMITALSFLIMSISLLFSRAVADLNLIKYYFEDKLLLFMNFIPVFIFMLLIYILSNRLWLAFFSSSLLFVTMSIVNKFKITYRDDPFSFIDIKLVKESLIMAEAYKIQLSPNMIILILILIAITIMLMKFFKPEKYSRRLRGILLLAVISLSIFMFKGFYFNSEVYAKVGDETKINKWIKSERFKSKGFIYPFIYSYLDTKESKVEGYDEEKAIADLGMKEYENIPEEQKVNIIAIMLEAYNDFSKFENVELGIDIYKNLHEIQKESIHGSLVTDVFAGDTVKTERSFLTGYHNHPKYFSETNSFVWYLKEQGYRTEAMHPIYGSFYNRRNINEYLGFDKYDYYENKYKEVQEDFLQDKDFFDYIIEGYENSVKNNQPYFNFSVTYQNHGPYSNKKYSETEFLKKKDYYNNEDYNIINNYFEGISRTDKALKKLFNYFKNEEEPTIIVIFGDHNPWLGQGNTGYNMLDINLDLNSIDGFQNYYQTPYIIWGNEGAKKTLNKEFVGKSNDISPNFLMAELFQRMGWKGNEYMQYIQDMKSKFDVNNKAFFKENGEYKNELSEESKKIWRSFQNIEYYYSHNKKGSN